MLSYVFRLCLAISLANSKRVSKEVLAVAFDEQTVSVAVDPCEALENCHFIDYLEGGAQAQTVRAELDGKEVVIKIDTKKKMEKEAANYESLASEDWSKPLLPALYQSGELSDGSVRLVIAFMQKPTEESACGWTSLGAVSMKNGNFEKVLDVPFEVAGKLWTSLLEALLLLKEHQWHHCDFHPYNIMVNQCTAEFKFIDWERSGQEPGRCPKGSDLLKLAEDFGVLFNRKNTNVLGFLMNGNKDPESWLEPGSNPKVLETAIKVLASANFDDAASEAKAIQYLLDLWAGKSVTTEEGEPEQAAETVDTPFQKCKKGASVARAYCCSAACSSATNLENCIAECKLA